MNEDENRQLQHNSNGLTEQEAYDKMVDDAIDLAIDLLLAKTHSSD
jgi:hypothetical protein